MVRSDCSQLVIFDIAEMDNVNSVGKICCTNLTGLLSPDLLHVCVSDMISCKYISHFQVVHVHVLLFILPFVPLLYSLLFTLSHVRLIHVFLINTQIFKM